MTCRAARTTIPRRQFLGGKIVKTKPMDLSAWRRSILEVKNVREINPWVPIAVFVISWLMWVRIVYQMAVLEWPIDLTVMGLS